MVKKSILIVDDESDIRYVLKKFFRDRGYTVEEAESGEDCLAKVEKKRPSLILLDILMPGRSGWEVCRKIKKDETLSEIPVSMLSVLDDSKDVSRSFDYALADRHLTKPIDFPLLEETVETLIAEYLARPPKPPKPLSSEDKEDYFKSYHFDPPS